MKTLTLRNLLDKTYNAASKISADISRAVDSAAGKIMCMIMLPSLRPQRIAVRSGHTPHPHRGILQ